MWCHSHDGEFVYQVEATQNYPGLYKFRTRILQPGHEYYVRVAANHPAYQLHTYRLQRAAQQGSARCCARRHGFPGQHGRHLALQHSAPRSGRPAHYHAALRNPALYRLPSRAVHDARLFEGGAEWISLQPSAQVWSFLPIAFTTTPGLSMESPIPTGCESSIPRAPRPAACRSSPMHLSRT